MGEAVRETVDRCERLIAGPADARAQRGGDRSRGAGRHRGAGRPTASRTCAPAPRRRRVEVRDELEPAWTLGEPALIERLVANLLDNGIHHNEPGGFLEVSTRVRRRPRRAAWCANGGPRIDPADAAAAGRAVPPAGPLGRRLRAGAVDRPLGGRGPRRPVTVVAPPRADWSVRVALPVLVRCRPTRAARADRAVRLRGLETLSVFLRKADRAAYAEPMSRWRRRNGGVGRRDAGIPAPCLAHRRLAAQADCDESAPRRLRVSNLPAIWGTGGGAGYDSRPGMARRTSDTPCAGAERRRAGGVAPSPTDALAAA